MKRLGLLLKKIIFLTGCCLVLASCHSTKQTASRWEDDIYAKPVVSQQIKSDSKRQPDVNDVRQKVTDAACSWIGVPYRYGGDTRSGVDCSGLVCMAFQSGAGIRLPRSSVEQADYCSKIARDKARAGDLMFFTNKKGGGRINHVAIYLGNDQVVHSTTSRGVIISSLNEEYWRTHFHSCGRILE